MCDRLNLPRPTLIIYQMAYLALVSSWIGDQIFQVIKFKFNYMCDRSNPPRPTLIIDQMAYLALVSFWIGDDIL